MAIAAIVAGVAMTSIGDQGEARQDQRPAGKNHLAGSTSPYLLQHQNNPVDWYPWGPEALAAARSQDKPIFLSIGYSACHWCHVMEEESFVDPNTAAVMNQYFISIKVDREERPDLDDIYMTAVQLMTGSGGWPMSVWLTPDLMPFYGGTYFPRDGRYGRPSFLQVLTTLGEAWRNDRASLVEQAGRVHEAVVQHMSGERAPTGNDASPGQAVIDRAIEEMTGTFDHTYGGFGSAPKFPPHRGLVLMLARYRQTKDENLIRMATLTFDQMAYGGMYDQIGGGFHRYATDPKWLVPHFEKMLYDNALLADAYLDAWQTTHRDLYRRVVREIFAWVQREMTDPEGAFYSTLDADSEGEEGRFYVWRPEEVTAIAGPADGALLNDYYGITARGNFEKGASIAHVEIAPDLFAERRKIPVGDLMSRIDAGRAKLLAAREARPHPHLDDKILTAWNGLMIAALARGSVGLGEPRYLDAATKAAGFILARMRGPDGLLRVSSRKGQVHPEAFLDDQAFFIKGLLALHEATGDARWLEEARRLVKATDAAFWDPDGRGYFFTAPDRRDLIVRAKNPTDGAIPSGNSVMAGSLLALHRLTGDPAYRRRAEEILTAFGPAMARIPGAFHNMLAVLGEYLSTGGAAGLTEPPVKVSARPVNGAVAPGGLAAVEVLLEIKPGWHVNASKPTLPYLIPTALTVEPDGGATLETADYPPGRMVALGFAGTPISVYAGTLPIRAQLRVDAAAPPGPLTVRASLSYQACDDRACLPPSKAAVDIDLLVGKRIESRDPR